MGVSVGGAVGRYCGRCCVGSVWLGAVEESVWGLTIYRVVCDAQEHIQQPEQVERRLLMIGRNQPLIKGAHIRLEAVFAVHKGHPPADHLHGQCMGAW